MSELDDLREEVRILRNRLALTEAVSDRVVGEFCDYELMRAAIAGHAARTRFCLFCENPPPLVHHADCPIEKPGP